MDPAGVVFSDLDGVIWRTHRAIEGSVEAVRRLQQAGWRVVFVTNNGSALPEEQEAKLASFGIEATGDVITSAMAAALLVEPGERALVCGGPGVVHALRGRGVEVVDIHDVMEDEAASAVGNAPDVDAVVVAFHRSFGFDSLRIGIESLAKGARLVGTNDDATYPTPDGPIPGGGSIVAAVATASGTRPVIAGKPHEPMARLVRRHFPDLDVGGMWMVGDRLSTDGAFARLLGCRFARVRSNVSEKEGDVPVTLERNSLAEVVDEILAG